MIRQRKDKPPLPERLPGVFVVIAHDREADQYTLHVDDEPESSYALLNDVPDIMYQFRWWAVAAPEYRTPKLYDTLCKTLDVAREYGRAQGIFKDGRVIPLFDRQDTRSIWNQEPATVNLPTL